MKTETFAGAKALSLDEITFTNRNHDYGAYELRSKYHKYLLLSFLFTAFLFISVTIVAYLYMNRSGQGAAISHTIAVSLTPTPAIVKPVVPPPPLLPKKLAGIIAFKPPRVVDTTDEHNPIPTNDDLALLLKNQPYDSTASLTGPINTVDPESTDPPYIVVSEPATFNGKNINSFGNWVMQNMNYTQEMRDLRLEGHLIVQFVVNKNGLVEDVVVLRGIDTLIDNELVRVIKSSPKWTPGKQNGREVRQQFDLPVVFKIQDQ